MLKPKYVVPLMLVVCLLASGCVAAAVPAIPAAVGTGAGLTAVETVVILTAPVVIPAAAAVIDAATNDRSVTTATVPAFAFELPVDTVLDGAATRVWSTKNPREGHRIAIVDDDDDYAESISRIIIFDFTASVSWFGSCEQLLGNFIRFDLYILDGQLPGVNGPTCAVKIRALDPTAKIIGESASERMVRMFKDLGLDATWIADGPKPMLALIKALLVK